MERLMSVSLVLLMLSTPLLVAVPTAMAAGAPSTPVISPGIEPMSYGNREKDITFLLHSINASETSITVGGHTTDRYMDTTLDFNGTTVITTISTKSTFTWYLYPELAGDLAVTHFDFKIWIWATSTLGTPQGNLTVNIYEVNATSWDFVVGNTTGSTSFLSTADLRIVSEDMNHTFAAGNTIAVNMTLDLTAGDSMTFAFDTPKANSRFSLRTLDGASLVEVYTTDFNGIRNSSFDPNAANKTIHINANVSDEIGGYDIKWCNVTLETRGRAILDNTTMVRVAGNDTSQYSIYEKEWNYTGNLNGLYNYTIWLVDNSGHNHFYHLQMYVWDNYTSEDEGCFSIGEMAFANLKVVDSKDVPLDGAVLQLRLDGTWALVGAARTNSTGMHNFTSVFTGTYRAIVVWQDMLVANASITIDGNVTEDDPLVIKADVFYPSFKVVDSKGTVLEGANIFVGLPNGSSKATPLMTNDTGEAALDQMANGTYTLWVRWMDVLVNLTTVDVTSNDTVTVYTAVYYLAATVVDSRAQPLAGAQIILANSTSGIVFDSKITNLSGGYEFRLPGGRYDISVYWQNTMIYYNASYDLGDNTAMTLVGDIYYLVVTVKDTHDATVSDAQVVVMTDEGNVLDSNFTDDSGRIDSRLPRGTHWVLVYWHGVEVNRSQVTFNDDSEVTLVASIYYPTFTILDADGLPVPNARLVLMVSGTDEVMESIVTDEDGKVTVRLPATTYDILVYWKTVLVYNETALLIDDDLDAQLTVSVFTIEVLCLDSRDMPLKDASVSITLASDDRGMASGLTDANGSFVVRLPGETYDIKVQWQAVVVAEVEGFILDASGQHVIHTEVFYIDGTAIDSQDAGLSDALIEVQDSEGSAVGTMLTDINGSFSLRLPHGFYSIGIFWMERLVNTTQGISLDEDLQMVFECAVYYLGLSPVDSKGLHIEDAFMTITSNTSGKVVTKGVTTMEAGTPTFRLPVDTYTMVVEWREVEVHRNEGYALVADEDLVLDCSVHYLTLLLIDDQDTIVEDALVTLSTLQGAPPFTGMSDASGEVVLRLPASSFDVNVSWHGLDVYYEEMRPLEGDEIWTLHLTIYYPELNVVDSRDAAVGAAHLDVFGLDGVLHASGDTDLQGQLTVRLAAATYRVAVTWLGHAVLDTEVAISSSSAMTLEAEVYYLEATFKDSRGDVIMDVILDISESGTDALMGTGLSDATGGTTIRLPTGTYDLKARWTGIKVFEEDGLAVTSDMMKAITADVFYLSYDLKDDRQLAVGGLLVEVFLDGEVFTSMVAGEDGKVEFRLPAETYSVKVYWRDIMVGSKADFSIVGDLAEAFGIDVFYLTIKVVDSEGTRLGGVLLTVLRDGTEVYGGAETKGKGVVEVRLPTGEYTIEATYSTTYMMSDYSSKVKETVLLDSSQDVKMTFSDFPPPIYTTNAFYFAMLSVVLIVLILVAAIKFLFRQRKE